MALFHVTAPDIAIDIGTNNTRIYVKNKGIVINEPSVVVVESDNPKSVVGIGESAEALIGRTAGKNREVHPLRGGVVVDYDMARLMVWFFLRKALGSRPMIGPRAVVTIPNGISKVEKSAVLNIMNAVGVRGVFPVKKSFAAALGTGLPVYEPYGSFIVDIGAGTTEVTVVSLGGIVLSHSIRVAGYKIDEAIAGFLKKEYSILVTDRIAEQIKFDLKTVYPNVEQGIAVVRGRDIATGMPLTVDVTKSEIASAIHDVLKEIMEAIRWVLGRIPPELASDIIRSGIFLTGGTSALPDLEKMIAEEFGIKVSVAKDAGECAILGAGYMADNYDSLDDFGGEDEK